MDQLLGEQHPAGLGDGDRRGAEVALEQATQLPLAHAEAVGKALHVGAVQGAGLDQREGARDGVGGSLPGGKVRRGLRAAAQAGSEPGRLSRRRGGEEGDVLGLGDARRADRPAVDAGRLDAHEQAAVEPGVPRQQGAI